jgi:hypothetical protein
MDEDARGPTIEELYESLDLPGHRVELPATSERVQPDLFICPADESTDGEWLIPAKDVLLAVEVVSPSSRRDDYEVKRAGCAQSEARSIWSSTPPESMITLFAGRIREAICGPRPSPSATNSTCPDPFGLTLDTATMPRRGTEQ